MIGLLIEADGRKITDSRTKEELLNSFFTLVFTQKEEKIQTIKNSYKGDITSIQVKIGKELVREYVMY